MCFSGFNGLVVLEHWLPLDWVSRVLVDQMLHDVVVTLPCWRGETGSGRWPVRAWLMAFLLLFPRTPEMFTSPRSRLDAQTCIYLGTPNH